MQASSKEKFTNSYSFREFCHQWQILKRQWTVAEKEWIHWKQCRFSKVLEHLPSHQQSVMDGMALGGVRRGGSSGFSDPYMDVDSSYLFEDIHKVCTLVHGLCDPLACSHLSLTKSTANSIKTQLLELRTRINAESSELYSEEMKLIEDLGLLKSHLDQLVVVSAKRPLMKTYSVLYKNMSVGKKCATLQRNCNFSKHAASNMVTSSFGPSISFSESGVNPDVTENVSQHDEQVKNSDDASPEEVLESLMSTLKSATLNCSDDGVQELGQCDDEMGDVSLGEADSPAVLEYYDFLGEFGRTGGWEERDHVLFLSLLRKHGTQDDSRLCEVLSERLAVKSRQEVIEHLDWYHRLMQLDRRRRVAVELWHVRRCATEEMILQQTLAEAEAAEVEARRQDLRRRQRLKQRRQDSSQQLEAWRARREAAAAASEQQSCLLPRCRIVLPRVRLCAVEQRIPGRQEKLQAHRLQQQQVEEDSRKERARVAAGMLPVFRRRDQEFVRRRRQQCQSQAPPPTTSAPAGSGWAVPRCPSRLLEDTEATRQRKLNRSVSTSVIIPIQMQPRRGVPQWRKGL